MLFAHVVRFTLALLVGALLGAAEAKQRPSATEPLQYEGCKSYDYPARHAAILKAKDALNPQIVMIGDSITHHWGGVPADHLRNGAKVLKSELGQYRILNLGFGHDRTYHVIWRLQNGEIDGLNPEWVVINIGTNNTSEGHTAAEIMAGIRVICEEVQKRTPKAKIILMSILPHDKKPTARRRVLIDETNTLIAAYATAQKFIHLDIGKEYLDADGNVMGKLMPDACHPNADGYLIWAKALKAIFDPPAKP